MRWCLLLLHIVGLFFAALACDAPHHGLGIEAPTPRVHGNRLEHLRVQRRCPRRVKEAFGVNSIEAEEGPAVDAVSFVLDGVAIEGELRALTSVWDDEATIGLLDGSGQETEQPLSPELRPESFLTDTEEHTVISTLSPGSSDLSALVLHKKSQAWTQVQPQTVADDPNNGLSRVTDSEQFRSLDIGCAEPLFPPSEAAVPNAGADLDFWSEFNTKSFVEPDLAASQDGDAESAATAAEAAEVEVGPTAAHGIWQDLWSALLPKKAESATDSAGVEGQKGEATQGEEGAPVTAAAEVPPVAGPFPAPWTPCYQTSAGDTTVRKVFIGVAVDVGVYQSLGSNLGNVVNFVTSAVTQANYVYANQLRMYLTVKKLTVQQSANNGFAWNLNFPAQSCPSIGDTLNNFTAWKASLTGSNQLALWHLFSSCYQPPGVVGLAWVGTLASSKYGTGVSSVFDGAWLTFAHEVGHNFGGLHAWGSDSSQVGKVGGIMDYGDGKYQGIFQFHPVNQPQVCSTLSKVLANQCSGGVCNPLANCFAASSPRCGDGLVSSPSEQCDDGDGVNGAASSCCGADCKYKPTTQCLGGECCVNCKFKDTQQRCGLNGQSYCSNGVCRSSTCTYYGLPYCGTKADNPCLTTCVVCSPQPCSTCSDMKGYTDTATGKPLNMSVPWGSVCTKADQTLGTCQADKCV